MSTLSREFRSLVRGRGSRLVNTDPERGSITLEQVIWTAGIAIAAVAVVAIIVAAINAYAGQIPTG